VGAIQMSIPITPIGVIRGLFKCRFKTFWGEIWLLICFRGMRPSCLGAADTRTPVQGASSKLAYLGSLERARRQPSDKSVNLGAEKNPAVLSTEGRVVDSSGYVGNLGSVLLLPQFLRSGEFLFVLLPPQFLFGFYLSVVLLPPQLIRSSYLHPVGY